ncbi:MAG: TIGR01777 family oxidoreductase [Cytophagales bacterium]|nr:TIGR01777 family oxidoreductase [Cytophagales bacterium]
MTKNVLITGGSGLLGAGLSDLLAEKGYRVTHLSRYKNNRSGFKTFIWDIADHKIEEGALDGVSHIIHLAGAGIADQKWSAKRKQILTSSRIDSANLIFRQLKSRNQKIESFISASAIGIYGFDTGGILQSEDRTQLGDDFLATLTKKWEAAADQFEETGARVVKLRIGMALSNHGGILSKLIPLANLGLSSAFGTGDQYISWIHIDDLVRMFVQAIESEQLAETYNAVAPNPVTQKDFLKSLNKTLNKPYFLPNTPKFVLKLVLGELASAITGGNKVSSKKIEETGFDFQFRKIDDSLNDLFRK